jgi:hypothetical protein
VPDGAERAGPALERGTGDVIQDQGAAGQAARTEFRLRGATLEGLGGVAARQAAEDLAQYARLGGLILVSRNSPWARSPIVSAEEARRADEVLDEVRRHTLPGTLAMLSRAGSETSLPEPPALAGWADLIDAWEGRRGLVGDDAGGLRD